MLNVWTPGRDPQRFIPAQQNGTIYIHKQGDSKPEEHGNRSFFMRAKPQEMERVLLPQNHYARESPETGGALNARNVDTQKNNSQHSTLNLFPRGQIAHHPCRADLLWRGGDDVNFSALKKRHRNTLHLSIIIASKDEKVGVTQRVFRIAAETI